MRKVKPLPKKKFQKMDDLLRSGYFIPIRNELVWGVTSFQDRDGTIIVNEIRGRFLGGGIHESYGYNVKLKDHNFWCKNFQYALRCVYGYLSKHDPAVLGR